MSNIIWNTPDKKPPAWLTDHSLPIPRSTKVRAGKYRRIAAATHGRLKRCEGCGGIVCKDEDVNCPNCGTKVN